MKEVLVILSAYKRNYFLEQIEAIKSQEGVIIKKILVWQNEHHVDVSFLREHGVQIFQSDDNCRYHGRFTLPLLYDNIEYTAIFDDDVIPSSKWLSNAIRCAEEYKCIATQNGRNHVPMFGCGDTGVQEKDLKVDFGGHSWVFKTEYVRYLWSQKQLSYETGEDLQFCLNAKLHGNIDTYCVRQNKENCGNLKPRYGGDEFASFRNMKNHSQFRLDLANSIIDKIKKKA